jgi:hypothetical protein
LPFFCGVRLLLPLLFLPLALCGQIPRFSLEGGWYDQPLTLHLEAEGHTIYYSLNGTTPRPGAAVYRQALTLDRTTVVRAIACTGGRCTPEQSHTFFIGEPCSAFPTLSVSVSPDALFNPEYGLYREGWMASRDSWKRPGANFWSKKELLAHAEIYAPDGHAVFRGNTGFRLFGGMSRLFPQKSFSLVARAHYGKKRIDYPVFGPDRPEKFKSLVFRNAGSDFGKSHFRDALMISLVENWDIETQDHQPAHVYLNGQYWGLYNIREKINRFFLEGLTGEDRDSIDLLEHNAHPKKGSAAHYKRMLEYIRTHDLAVDSHFLAVQRMMDTDNFLHYQIAQIYFDNQDAGGNIRFWRPRRPDGRWRWILYDVDQGFGLHSAAAYTHNTLAFHLEPNGPSWPNPPWSTYLLRSLLRNEGFRDRFIQRFFEVLYTDLVPERVEERIRTFAEAYRPEIPRHFERWRLSARTWEDQVAGMTEFARRRPDYLRRYLCQWFGLPEPAAHTLIATEGGILSVGPGLQLQADSAVVVHPAGTALHLEARAHPGYRFAGWEGLDGSLPEARIRIGGAPARIRACFEPYHHELAQRIVINEIGANNRLAGDWVEIFNASDQPVDVTSWILADAKHQYRLPSAMIPAGGYLVFCQDLRRFKNQFPGVPAAAGTFSFGLNRLEESVYLYSYDGAFVDSIQYRVLPQDTLFTLALLLPDLDNADPRNWEIRRGAGTPGAGNPHYVQSQVMARQQGWLRAGLYCGGVLLLSVLIYGHWSRRRARA